MPANVDQKHGLWVQLKGRVKQLWGKSTGDRKTQVKGGFEEAGGRIQEGIGNLRQELEQPNRI
ncbi:MAG: CsbD family protein [Myxococcaceae bacterium]